MKDDPLPNRRPTLRDVAKRAGGVHPSTVSLAMRNHPGISTTLRKKIKEAAAALGYRPDPLLDAFNSHRVAVQPHRAVSTVAWVAEGGSRREVLDDPIAGALWGGAQRAAELFHCQIELFLLGPGQLTGARLNTVLHTRGIVGVVLAHLPASTPSLALDWDKFCTVRIDSRHLPHAFYGVSFDHRQAVRLAWQHLRQAGHRRIGLVTANDLCKEARHGYEMALNFEQARLPATERTTVLRCNREDVSAVKQWARIQKLDALITSHYAHAFAELDADLVCLDHTACPPKVTCTVADYAAAGANAVEQAVMLMRGNQRGLPSSTSVTLLGFSVRG